MTEAINVRGQGKATQVVFMLFLVTTSLSL